MFDFGIRVVQHHSLGVLVLLDAGGYRCGWYWHEPHSGILQQCAPGSLAAPMWYPHHALQGRTITVVVLCMFLLLAPVVHAQLCPVGCQPDFLCVRCDDRHRDEGRETCFDCATQLPVGDAAVLACTACRWNLKAARWTLMDCSPCSVIHVQGTP